MTAFKCLRCKVARINEFFDGAINEVMLWNRPLSRTEIERLYNSLAGMNQR